MSIILYIVGYIAASTIVALILKKDWAKLDKVLKSVYGLAFDISYELGKVLFLTGVVGLYFIPETGKDFESLVKSGIFFYLVGYIFRKKD